MGYLIERGPIKKGRGTFNWRQAIASGILENY
jgi:hypothetical protein